MGIQSASRYLRDSQKQGVDIGDLASDKDLVLFMTCAGYERRSRIYLNDGRGRFYDIGQDLGDTGLGGNAVYIHDIDGDRDLFIANYSGGSNEIWYNNLKK